ncbi:MAG: DUF4405 domain-containing protein [Candidatus Aminicenantes bacterium]|nr:DUF4405 domain-containing protein [Candidatus Aminicenantes bacterium]
MKKTDWQYIVDTLLFLCIFGISFIGILLAFFLPKGPSVSESQKYLLGLHRHQWGDIHMYLSLAFVVLVIIHLTLAWSWIKGKSKNLFKGSWRTVLVSTIASAFIVVVLFWFFTPKNSRRYADYGSGSGGAVRETFYPEDYVDREGEWITITGQLTLENIEQITGVASEEIIEALSLPSSTSRDETLGQLRKKYGITLVEFRDIVTDLMNKSDETLPPSEHYREKISQGQETAFESAPEHAEKEHEDKLIRGRLAEDTSGILITGRMTLRDLEDRTGISSHILAEKLGLPSHVSIDEHIGRLRRRYGFSIQDVRDVITSLMEQK